MAISIRLDEKLVSHAKIHAEIQNRSVAKQIEYWAKVGQMMTDNPNLPYEFAREALLATEEVKQGMVTRYVRRSAILNENPETYP